MTRITDVSARLEVVPSLAASSLTAPLSQLARVEGLNSTDHPAVTVYRVSRPDPPTPTLYGAAVILVGQGRKRGHLGLQAFDYHPGQYLVVTSPMPMLCEVPGPLRLPVLTMAISLQLDVIVDVIDDVDHGAPVRPVAPAPPVFVAQARKDLIDAATRLAVTLTDQRDARVLATQGVREVLYRVLMGPYGDALRDVALANSRVHRLARAMRHMNRRFAEPIRVEDLAKIAHMSVPTFHHHFKLATSRSPLQYLKAVRLTKARLIMLQSGVSAKSAAQKVGYESASQFSREFKRFFGAPPATNVSLEQRNADRAVITFSG